MGEEVGLYDVALDIGDFDEDAIDGQVDNVRGAHVGSGVAVKGDAIQDGEGAEDKLDHAHRVPGLLLDWTQSGLMWRVKLHEGRLDPAFLALSRFHSLAAACRRRGKAPRSH